MNISLRSRRNNDVTRTCRICLKVDLLNGVLIGSEGTWLELFQYCFDILIKPEDVCKRLCGECADKINDFSEFKKLALRSNKLWQSSINVPFNSSKNAPCEKRLKPNKQKYNKTNVVTTKKCGSNRHNGEESDSDVLVIDDDYFENKNIKVENVKSVIVTCESQNNTKEEIEVEFFEPLNETINEREEEILESQNYTIEEVKEESLDPQNYTIEEFKEKSLEEKNDTVEGPFMKKGLYYICKTCKKSFRTKLLLKNHFIKKKCHIPEESGYYCGLCDVTLPDEEKLKHHVTGHCLNNELSCKLCDYVGRDFADMTMHRYSHMPSGSVKTIMCHLFTCNKKFNVHLALQYHYRVAHLKKSGGWCSVCNKQFVNYKSWRNHEKLHRSNNYICDTCGRKFLFKHAIIKHLEIHSDYKGYICHCCGKAFNRNSNLTQHLLTAHDNKKVKCKHCDKVFKNQKSLEFHLQKISKGSRHPCKECHKSFPTTYLLKCHMIWHTDERPYVCNVCGLSYKVAGQLRIHMRNHTGEMPYKCEYCNRCFPSSHQVKVHMAVHTGQRRNKCSFCPRSFHGKKLLVEHCVKLHSGREVTQIEQTKIKECDIEKQSNSEKKPS